MGERRRSTEIERYKARVTIPLGRQTALLAEKYTGNRQSMGDRHRKRQRLED